MSRRLSGGSSAAAWINSSVRLSATRRPTDATTSVRSSVTPNAARASRRCSGVGGTTQSGSIELSITTSSARAPPMASATSSSTAPDTQMIPVALRAAWR